MTGEVTNIASRTKTNGSPWESAAEKRKPTRIKNQTAQIENFGAFTSSSSDIFGGDLHTSVNLK
jgi:hypothetical protein